MSILQDKLLKVYISEVENNFLPQNTTRVNVTTGGTNFSRDSFVSEIFQDIIDSSANRSVDMEIEGFGRTSFNFSTHLRGKEMEGNFISQNKLLWSALTGRESSQVITESGNETNISFDTSDITYPKKYFVWYEFIMPDGSKVGYKFSNVIVDVANLNVQLSSFPKIDWRLMAEDVTPTTTFPDNYSDFSQGYTDFHINPKTTCIELDGISYPYTGFNMIFSNNASFVEREQVGKNKTIVGGHFNERVIDGEINLLLQKGKKLDLFEELISEPALEDDTFRNLKIYLGGKTGTRIELELLNLLVTGERASISTLTTANIGFSSVEQDSPLSIRYVK